MNNGNGDDRIKRIKQYHLLIRKFNHGDLPDRISAAKNLVNFPNVTTANALLSPIFDAPFELQLTIIDTLIRIKANNTDDTLLKLYSKATNKTLKFLIINAISQIGSPDSIGKFFSFFHKENDLQIQVAILKAVSKATSVYHLESEILRLAEDKSIISLPSLLIEYLRLIAKLGGKRFISIYYDYFNTSKDEDVIIEVFSILSDFDKENFSNQIFNSLSTQGLPEERKNIYIENLEKLHFFSSNIHSIRLILKSDSPNIIRRLLRFLMYNKARGFKEDMIFLLTVTSDPVIMRGCIDYLTHVSFLEKEDIIFLIRNLSKIDQTLFDYTLIQLEPKIGKDRALELFDEFKDDESQRLNVFFLRLFTHFSIKNPMLYKRSNKFITSEDPATRFSVFLYRVKLYKEIKFIDDFISDRDEGVRFNVVKIIFQNKLYKYAPILAEQFKDQESAKIRSICVTLFGDTKNKEYLPILNYALSDKDPRVRSNAIESLELFDLEEDELKGIMALLDDENNRVKANAAKTLWKFGGLRMLSYLHKMLNENDNKWHRASAAFALGEIKSEQCKDFLIEAIDDQDFEVRRNVVLALGKVEAGDCVELLANKYINEHKDVKLNIIHALEMIGNEQSSSRLATLLDFNDLNSLLICNAFIKINIKKPNKLVRFLNHPDEEVVVRILRAIGKYGDENVESLVSGLCENPVAAIQAEATRCLKSIYDKKRFIKF